MLHLAAAAAGLLALAPLAFLVEQAAGSSMAQAVTLLFRPRVGELLRNTLVLDVFVTAASVLLGTAAAWLTECTTLACARAYRVLLVLPVAIPEFVNGYTWVSLNPRVQGLWASALVSTLSLYPLVYLPVAAMLSRRGGALDDVARSLGAGPLTVVWRVVLPQLRPALIGGAVIVSLHLLGEYGAFALLRYPTFALAVFNQYRLGFDPAGAAVLSLVLVALCMAVLGAQTAADRGGPVTDRTGPATASKTLKLGRGAGAAAHLGLGGLLALALGVPALTLTSWLLRGSSSTLPGADIVQILLNTLGLGLAAAAASIVLALPVAALAARHPGPLGRLWERASYLNRALPGVTVALALVFFTLRSAAWLYQSSVLLVAAYTLLFLPLAVVTVKAGTVQVPAALPELASSLGIRPVGAWFRVTLPLLVPALASGAALVFLSTITELTATLLLHPTGVQTLATQFWVYTTGQSYGAAAPYAALMVALSAGPTLLLVGQLNPHRRRASVQS